jgi:hypothetical protein
MPVIERTESTDLCLSVRERFWRWRAVRRERRRKARMVRDAQR